MGALTKDTPITLALGAHRFDDGEACAMEWVSILAGEPFSDHPQCACPVIASFVREWNDCLSDADRDRLLVPVIRRLIGTRDPALEERRAWMATDWLARVCAPAWLRLAKLDDHAAVLTGLGELVDDTTAESAQPALSAARSAAWSAADSAAWSAAWSAARSAADSAARSAAWSAADSAAWSAAWSAARSAADSAARSAAWSAARSAAWSAAWSAARSALEPTVVELQQSALDLLGRMIDVKAAD